MLTPATLDSYQAGARAVRAKSLGSLALGAAALAGVASEAGAAISAFTVTSHNVASAPYGRFVFDVVTGATSNSFFPTQVGGVIFNTSSEGDGRAAYLNDPSADDIQFAVNSPSDVQKLGFGDAVNGRTFSSQAYLNNFYAPETATSVWAGNTGYVGFKRLVSNTYGWLKFSVNADASAVTLLAIAYNDAAGGGITAGQISSIPEPATSAALLGLGAAGLAAYRRRKQIARAAA